MLNFIENLLIRNKVQQVFETTIKSRNMILGILQNYTLEQLNKIPAGFNNNLIWNIGHIIVAQQVLVYKLSGLQTHVSDQFIDAYKKGTKPERDDSQEEVDEIRMLLSSTILQTEKDYTNNVFNNYTTYMTSMGFELTNVDDALSFVNYHEGIHTGIIMSIRKFV